jgi:hypothetical protein
VRETGGKQGEYNLKCGGKLKMPGRNGGKHGGDNLQGGEGQTRVGEA